jgi:hypothetical protein
VTDVTAAFSPDALREALNADPEFRLQARFWTGALRFRVERTVCALSLDAGRVADAVEIPDDTPVDGDRAPPGVVEISAPRADWERFLQNPPRPFYVDYYGASLHHGFDLGGDHETIWAYYGAIRRTADVLRSLYAMQDRG